MNKRQQNKIEKLLFKIYDSGLKQVDCDLTTCAKEIEKALIIQGVSNWVAVEEKLPRKYENVIIRNENNIVTTDQISDNGWVFEELTKVKVTHWQNLPKPPCC